MSVQAADRKWMQRALDLAVQGEGKVEPNPMVGCVLVRDGQVIGEGWHQRYGDRHAETEALAACQIDPAQATAYVTLEPCAHFGKQPPCADALIAARIARVVVAMPDPFEKVAGAGLARLQNAGIEVECGVLQQRAERLNAPYLKRVRHGLPWVIAKWAMTLDGRIATAKGDSRWISNSESREQVHQLRRRCDAILVGIGTVLADDPLLTARPSGTRVLKRVILDSKARLPLDSKLLRSLDQGPVVVVCEPSAASSRVAALRNAGAEVWASEGDRNERVLGVLRRLAAEGATNLLVEGGSQVLGSLLDLQAIDEVWTFVAPKLVGGAQALGPVAGEGHAQMSQATELFGLTTQSIGRDVWIRGFTSAAMEGSDAGVDSGSESGQDPG